MAVNRVRERLGNSLQMGTPDWRKELSLDPHVQRWTFRVFVKDLLEGFWLAYQHLIYLVKTQLEDMQGRFLEVLRRLRRLVRHKRLIKGDPLSEWESNASFEASKNSSPKTSSSLASTLMEGELEKQSLDEGHPSTLHYGFMNMAKLFHITFLYIPAFSLSIRLGLRASKLFVVISYVSLVVFAIIGVYVVQFVSATSIEMFVKNMNDNLKQICVVSTLVGQSGFVIFGLVNCGFVFYQRKFLQDFIYHQCSMITLDRSYQRRQICCLFLALNAFAYLTEPLFGLLALTQDFRQPLYWPDMDPNYFGWLRVCVIVTCGTAALPIGSANTVVPLMTCFLIVTSTKHLKNLVAKQSGRYNQTTSWMRSNHNKELEALVNDRTRKIMRDYACETLTMDWPELIGPERQADWELDQLSAAASPFELEPSPMSRGSSLARMIPNEDQQVRPQCQRIKSSRSSSTSLTRLESFIGASGFFHQQSANVQTTTLALMKPGLNKASRLLFLYKNLIKNMSELKCLILSYERRFGNFHQTLTLISSLIVSLWVTSALTEARRTNAEGDKTAADGQQKAAYTLRILGSSLAFVAANIFIFLKCDCLSSRIIKIKGQLFKMNIDLGCTLLQGQQRLLQQSVALEEHSPSAFNTPQIMIQCDPEDAESKSTNSSKPDESLSSSLSLDHFQRPRTRSLYRLERHKDSLYGPLYEQYVNQCPELDQVWALYDQVERISSRTNFKFTSDTYYSKKCMLLVFGRCVSLILFFIQIVDMYSSY